MNDKVNIQLFLFFLFQLLSLIAAPIQHKSKLDQKIITFFSIAISIDDDLIPISSI